MKYAIDSAKRIVKVRIKDYLCKVRFYGFAFATWDLLWWICFYIHPPFAWKLSTYAIKSKTVRLDSYIEKKYKDIIDTSTTDFLSSTIYNVGEQRIWVFWGQGDLNMPKLVKSCYRQMLALNENVTLITKSNLYKFVDIPQIVYTKVEQGNITWAHFSDIIRTSLLAKYGGLWLDATVWTTKRFPFEQFAKLPFYSANGKVTVNNRSIRFWTSFQWNWSTWCMFASSPNNPLFCFVSRMLQAIAIREKYWPDYVVQDYLIYYACRKFPQIGAMMTECNKINFINRNRLAEIMNCPFGEEEYQSLIASDYVFKLSFRSDWRKETKAGKVTYYGKLIDNNVEG